MRLAFVCSGEPKNLLYLDNNRAMVNEVLSKHKWKVINTPLSSLANLNIELQKYPKNSIDEFLFFYTGHGSYSNFQSTFQLEVDNATIKINDIQEVIFESLNPKKQAIIIDACYSGTLDNLILKRDIEFLFSSQAIEQSYESYELKSSIFSYYFCEAISQNMRFLSEIEEYVQSKNSRQTPLRVNAGRNIIEIANCKVKIEPKEYQFVVNLMEELESQRAILLFSQRFTDIEKYYQAIKRNLKTKFGKEYYKISIPSTKSEKRYFASVAKSCGIKEPVKELQDWKDAMEDKLNSSDDIMLFIPDLEDGNDKYNRKFATTIRNLHNEYSNLFVIFIGRKKLASLVSQEKHLSPLRSLGSKKFFPDEELKLKEQDIVIVFENFLSNKNNLCTLLTQKRIERYYSPWSRDRVINKLFWENLLIHREKYFVWRSEEIMNIGREILGC